MTKEQAENIAKRAATAILTNCAKYDSQQYIFFDNDEFKIKFISCFNHYIILDYFFKYYYLDGNLYDVSNQYVPQDYLYSNQYTQETTSSNYINIRYWLAFSLWGL